MRTPAPTIVPLFRSELQLQVLGLLFLGEERWWTLEEIREAVDAPRASVHRELRRAFDAGILEREVVGTTHRYRAAWESPLASPISELLDVTVGVERNVREALEHVGGVDGAVIYGSFANGKGIRPQSDVDMLVFGTPDVRDVRRALRHVERAIGREINTRTFPSADEFRSLADAGDGFARHVIDNGVVPLIGTGYGLAPTAR